MTDENAPKWARQQDWAGVLTGDKIHVHTLTVCEGHYGHTADLTDSQQAVMRVTTPDVGMKCYLEFTQGSKVIYTTEITYKRIGVSLTEHVAMMIKHVGPASAWPRNSKAEILKYESNDSD